MDELREALLALARMIVTRARSFQVEGGPVIVPCQRIPVKNINYEDNTYQYDLDRCEYFDVYKWDSNHVGDFLRREVYPSTEYASAIATYTTAYGYPEDGARSAFGTFNNYFIDRVSSGGPGEEEIERYADRFIEECGSDFKTLTLEIELWVGNVYLESDEIELESGVFLKRATAKQLEQVGQRVAYIDELSRFAAKVVESTVILSFQVKAKWSIGSSFRDTAVVSEIEAWLNVLRLFRPSSVYVAFQTIKQRSIFGYEMAETKERPGEKFLTDKVEHKDTSVYRLEIMAQDEEKLRTFSAHIKPLISQILPTTYLTGSSIDLALHRYTDALVKSEITAYKVLSAITSIEALLSEGKTEIIYRIRMRTASIMRILGFETKDVYEKMGKAYDLRSKLVHGGSIEKLREFAGKHGFEIMNYNRVCLLVFLQLQSSINKNDLVSLIDCSLIDEAERKKLEELMAGAQIT